MSLDIYPPIPPDELKTRLADIKNRELKWITDETLTICSYLKHGLEDCYALLAPIDPGSTLVMSTPRNEKVKGTITRVGTRIVKSSLNVQLRTIPPLNLSLNPQHAIHVRALDDLHTHLTQSIDLLSVILSPQQSPDPISLSSTLSILSENLSSSSTLLKGPPLTHPDPSWQTTSVPPSQFQPLLPPNISVHVSLQDSSVVLTLRALEPVHAPVHFGTKLALAIGTVRRLEHDEMDLVFRYNPSGCEAADSKRVGARHNQAEWDRSPSHLEDVYVREKVRVDSADPSLISLYSKLGYLSNVLGRARDNLDAVLGKDSDDDDDDERNNGRQDDG